MRRFSWLLLVVVAAWFPLHAQEMEIPALSRYATDLSGTLTSGELARLERMLRTFDDSTSTQIVVLMVPSMGGGSLEDITLRIAEKNRIGRERKNNGVLLFVAMEDRRIRIEVGYGLEGALPDALTGLIIRREITPHFREGDYYGGIMAGVESIMAAVKDEYRQESREDRRDWGSLIPALVVIALLVMLMSRMRGGGGGWGMRSSGLPWIIGGMGGGFRGGGFGGRIGGGSFGGGGFSGGGGSFGGGGASGSW
ncbi:MAG: TPM domain-containing protein [Bacteroidota bacterium]